MKEYDVRNKDDIQYYGEVKKVYDGVAKNEKIEEEDKKSLLKEINDTAASKTMSIDELKSYVDGKTSDYEAIKEENDRKRKKEEDRKRREERIWISAALEKRLEEELLTRKQVEEEIKKKKEEAGKNADKLVEIEVKEKEVVTFLEDKPVVFEEKKIIPEEEQQPEKNAFDEGIEEFKVSFGDSFDFAEHNRAQRFIDGAAAFDAVRNGVMSWIIGIDDKINGLAKNSPDDRYRTDAYKRFTKAVSTLRKNISNDKCKQNDIVNAFYELKDAANAYKSKHDEPKNELGKTIADIRNDVAGNIETIANTYDNARRAVMFEGNGKVSYANLPAGDIMRHQAELMEKYGIRDSSKEYDFEKMNEISKAQLELRKKIAKISPTLEKEYEFSKSRSAYLKIKKNAKVSDLARYYVCSRYLDNVYSPLKCITDADNNVEEIKSYVDKFDAKSVKKEIEVLSKNKLFKACVEKGGKNAFSEWLAIENESDTLKTEYETMLNDMGGNDPIALSEYAMNTRTLYGDDITFGNRREVAGLICEDVGKVIALQILTDPKSRNVLNAAALDIRDGKDRLKELAESASNYLKSKGYFNYRAGAENDAKCAAKIKDVLSSGRIKSNIMKNFEQLQTAKIKEAKRVKNAEAKREKMLKKEDPKNIMMPRG